MAEPDIPTAELDPAAAWAADPDSAALSATKGIGKGLEAAGVLYKNADGKYSSSNAVSQGTRDAFALRAKMQPGHTLAGIFHNHPGTDDNGQVFSPRDIAVADQLKVPSYVYFEKSDTVRKYVPGQTATRSIPDPISPRNWVKVADGDPVQDSAAANAAAVPGPAAAATPTPQSDMLVTGSELTGDTMADASLNSLYTQNPGTTDATASQAAGPTPVTAQTAAGPSAVTAQTAADPTAVASQNATAGTVNTGGTLAQAQQYSAAQNTVDPSQLASNQLADITSQDSPLMEQARAEANQSSNSRGLLNSTLAGGAAEAAMVQQATPLAEQNAATEANSSLANQAATNTAAATNAQLGTQVSTSNAATQAQIASLNAQMQTAVSQGNAQQANAIAEQLQTLQTQTGQFNAGQTNQAAEQTQQLQTQTGQFNAGQANTLAAQQQQLQTQTGQFNAAQTNTASLQNTQEANAMTSQVLQANSSLNQQFLAGTQSEDLATIQGRYQNLIASNSAASSMYTSYMNSIAATMANTSLDPARAAQIVQIQQQSLEAGLQLMNSMNSLDPETGGTITPTNTGQPSISTAGGAGGLLSAGATATGQGLSNALGSSTTNPSTAGGVAASTAPSGGVSNSSAGLVGLLGSAATIGGKVLNAPSTSTSGTVPNVGTGTTATPTDTPVTGGANLVDTPTSGVGNLVSSPGAALSTAGGLYGIASGLSKGGVVGDTQAALSAGSIAAKAGVLPAGSGTALGAAGSVLGLYSGLKQGGAVGDTQAALSAATLAAPIATAAGAAGLGTALAAAGPIGLALAPALYGMSTPAVQLTSKYWTGVTNSLQQAIDSGDKGQIASQVNGLLAQPQGDIPANVQQLVYSTGMVPSMGWGQSYVPNQSAAASQILQQAGNPGPTGGQANRK